MLSDFSYRLDTSQDLVVCPDRNASSLQLLAQTCYGSYNCQQSVYAPLIAFVS